MEREIPIDGEATRTGRIITAHILDLTGLHERLEKIEEKLEVLTGAVQDLQRTLDHILETAAETGALVRKQIRKQERGYDEFCEWVRERLKGEYDIITTPDVVAEFDVSRLTALRWMKRLAESDSRYRLFAPGGQKPHRLVLNTGFRRV